MEVAVPILDEDIQNRIRDMFDTMMKDVEKGKIQDCNGNYLDRGEMNADKINSQELFYQQAYDNAKEDGEKVL